MAVGAVVPAGLYHVVSNVSVDGGAGPAAGWLLVVALAGTALGTVRDHPTESLLSGGLVGVVVGFVGFALLVGWGLVAFALPLLSSLAWIAGTWVAYERRRRLGNAFEPNHGTWRMLFATVVAVPVLGLVMLSVL